MRTGKESERVTCFPRVCDATLRGAGADPTRARSLECSSLPVSRRCTKETAREPEPAVWNERDRELGQRRERCRQRTAAAATAVAAEALRQGARQLSAGRRQLTAHSSSAPRPLSARSARAGSVRHLTCTFPLQIVFLSDSFASQFTLADSSNMLDAQSQLKAHAQTARSWWRRSTHARNPGAHARGGAVSGSWWRVWRLADALLHNGC
ncbi:uncharacterized protein LOC124775859 [Schistocerca piceifrons]|uniref:uncharacterized protein LOC124775859 n=1 Tax=Schistocerca piceifrons TaxID=274613 RepID=UPI001F5F7451|nr:uncharacterized protein LOC124775859 [Schistocerca piceifrons]